MASYQDDDLNFGITLDNGPSTDRQLTENTQNPKSKTLQKILEQKKIQDQNKTKKQEIEDEPLSLSLSKKDYSLYDAGHPIVCIFTFIFKALALLIYLIISRFMSSTVLVFISTIILSATDFWVVKNISGRLLVGMRWWTAVDQKGNQTFKFETLQGSDSPRRKINKIDKAFFWSSQIVSTLFWGLILLLKCLTLSFFWGLLVAINFGLSAANLYGYYLCRGQKKNKKLSSLGKQIGLKGITKLASMKQSI